MWIKICANTNLEDAQRAADLGADALGFVFAPSRRQVTAHEVAAITQHLPETIERIGVFDTHTASEIIATVRHAHLSGVQLHRPLDAALVTDLTQGLGSDVCIIQTVAWAVGDRTTAAKEVEHALEQIDAQPAVCRVLIDSRVGPVSGGTGVPFGWSDAAEVLHAGQGRHGLIVAGGLRPENVAAAISILRPWGVDVATGVEQVPGQKRSRQTQTFHRERPCCRRKQRRGVLTKAIRPATLRAGRVTVA